LIGINNRDLHTFNVTLDTTRALRRLIPPGIVVVSESGIYTRADRESLGDMDIDALLVGESLLVSDDIARATRLISGISSDVSERSVA